MSYLNPLLTYGYERLAAAALAAGVCGFIVPDLPLDESAALSAALDVHGLALVQMVTPVTPPERLARLCAASQGFVYAVTMTGTTGKSVAVPDDVIAYLERVRSKAKVPVCAGFGIRSREQVVAPARPCRRRDRGLGAGRAARARRIAAGLAARAAARHRVKSPAEPAAHSPRLTIVLALLSTLGPFTIDTFFPSMRAMAAEFGISYWQVQQTLTAYLVPYALHVAGARLALRRARSPARGDRGPAALRAGLRGLRAGAGIRLAPGVPRAAGHGRRRRP